MINNLRQYLCIIFLFGPISFVFFSCKTTEIIPPKTERLNQTTGISPNTYIYSLPKTTVRATVESVRTIFIKGPYCEFAEKYLSIQDAQQEDNESWNISDIKIDTYEESDPDHYYVINYDNGYLPVNELLKLSEEGLVINPVNPLINTLPTNLDLEKVFEYEVPFTDLSVKRNLEEVTDTLYRTVFRDSVFVRVPILEKHIEVKTLEEKAEEAAAFLVKLRKRRFKLLSGQYDVYPEGTALETSVRELNDLEKKYLSLFIGKTYKNKYSSTFEFCPDENNEIKRKVLFRFSGTKGVLQENDLSGEPVMLEIISEGKTDGLQDLLSRQTSPEEMPVFIFYRIPDAASLEIIYGNRSVGKKRLRIYQFGKVVSLPVNFLPEER